MLTRWYNKLENVHVAVVSEKQDNQEIADKGWVKAISSNLHTLST